ncbi:DUF2207 domain-containing protein [Kallipyga massiliensis]|uniref:DUF2207 domain-containing protein n=1 Tax=Kallipyga massiliensis TaxID=1472764 RepID=UPI0026F173C7|nr:DUF2207 domain-containing protein [Kallipyga massiliensis]
MKRKYTLCFIFFIVCCISSLPPQVHAEGGDRVRLVLIQANLKEDGSANIREEWDIEIASDSTITEWYLPKSHLNGSTINNFVVMEDGRVFEDLGSNWDVDRTREEKAGKSGFVESEDGVELCFGIGSPGLHHFTLTYQVSELVDGFRDKDGFYWRFVNDQMSPPPESVRVEVRGPRPFTSQDVELALYGNTGSISINEEGKILAHAEGSDYGSKENHMTLLVSFTKGIFSPEKQNIDQDFEDLANQAEEDGDFPFWIIPLIIFLVVVPIALVILFYSKARKKEAYLPMTRKEKNSVPIQTTPPFQGDLVMAYMAMKITDESLSTPILDQRLQTAFLLDWALKGILDLSLDDSKGFFEEDKSSIHFLNGTPGFSPEDLFAQALWDFFIQASEPSHRLTIRALQDHIRKNDKAYEKLWKLAKEEGERKLLENGNLERISEEEALQVTAQGHMEIPKVYGYRNYLLEWIDRFDGQEDDPNLQETFVFACLFGLMNSFEKKAKKLGLQPADRLSMSQHSYGLPYYYFHSANHFSQQSQGSFSSTGSMGGGGGFSGGGSGGGGR